MSKLFDDSSLAMIPSAYKDGRLYSIRPVEELGDELITNGTFDTDSDWTKGTGWTISGGKLVGANANTSTYQGVGIQVNKSYKIEFSVVDYVSGSVRPLLNGLTNVDGTNVSANGTYTQYLNSISTSNGNFTIRGVNFVGSIDNVSVKEVITNGDFTFSRGSNLAATRVDVNGLIEKGRENLLLQSNSFDTTWASSGTTETSGQSGYDGTNNAWLLIKSVSDGYVYQNISQSGVQCVSVYAKANAIGGIQIYVNAGTTQEQKFNLTNGTLIGSGNNIDAKIESVGNGWYRCSMALSDTITRVRFYPITSAGDKTGTSGSIFIQDAQLESSLVATDYIETGASTAQAGILEDMPRLDYSGGASCPALLLEPQRSNLYTYSEYYDSYTKASCTITSNAIISPEGLKNASKIVSASGGPNIKRIQPSINTSGANEYIISAFAKKAEWDYLFIYGAGTLVNGSLTIFNLDNGTIEQGSGHATIEAFGNDGWYKITWKATSTGTGTGDPRIGITDNESSSNSTGDGTSGVYLYGLQIEQASYPTSYIPTMGASVTRSADRPQILNTTTDILSQTAFTLFFEADLTSDTANNFRDIVAFRGASKELRFETRTDNSVRVQSNMITSGDSFNSATIGDTDNKKFAMTFTTSQVRLYADGSLVNTYNGAYSSDLVHILFMNSTSLGVETKTNFKQYILFPTALTDSECIALTTL